MVKELDVLILEDSEFFVKLYKTFLKNVVNKEKYQIAKNTSSYKKIVSSKNVKAAFLDDQVPNGNDITEPQFMKNCDLLLRRKYEPEVFYIGTSPSTKTKDYCNNHGIEIIEKKKVPEKIKQLIEKNTI